MLFKIGQIHTYLKIVFFLLGNLHARFSKKFIMESKKIIHQKIRKNKKLPTLLDLQFQVITLFLVAELPYKYPLSVYVSEYMSTLIQLVTTTPPERLDGYAIFERLS